MRPMDGPAAEVSPNGSVGADVFVSYSRADEADEGILADADCG